MTSAQKLAPTQLGPYEVGAKIGGGGMASIYVGLRTSGEPADEVVAIKLIKDDYASEQRYIDMFLDEARILSRLDHPNIIVTRDFGVDGDTRFIAMELLLGRSLLDAFEAARESEKRMPLDLAAFVALQVAEALAYAHALKSDTGDPLHLVHRDVNPTNIFLTYYGKVKLIDFGLAKSSVRLHESGEGVVKGKVPYLSPEQIDEKPFDGRADLYTLGATLWEMTVGRRLFKRESDVATLLAIRDHEVPDPRTIVDDYPDAMWDIVRRALEPDPEARFENGEAMARELRAFLDAHGRKGDLTEALAAWVEDLFPGERAKQEEWLAQVSAAKASSTTMRPPAPLAGDAPAPSESASESPSPAPVEAKTTHPVAALLALAGTIAFLLILALVFHRC